MNNVEKGNLKEKVLASLEKMGDYIKDTRQAKNIKLSDLAKLSGVSSSVISDLENHKGVIPSIYTIIAIANALDVELETIISIFTKTQTNKIKKIVSKDDFISNSYKIIETALIGLDYTNSEVSEIIDFIKFKGRNKIDTLSFYK